VTEGPVGASQLADAIGDEATLDVPPPEPSGTTQRSTISTAQIVAAVAILGVVGLVVPVVIARMNGAMGIARNDDWSYLRTLFNWVDTGHLDFNSWVSMTLLMQLVFAAPIVFAFGHNITLIQLETAVLGFAGLCLVLWIGITVTRRIWVATFAALLVAVGPLWGSLSVSYMTDVPAFAVSMLACALGVRAFKRPTVSLPYLIASLAAGLVGFTIRQYAAVPPIAVALVGGYVLWRERSKPRILVFLLTCVAVLAAAAVFWAYWRTIPHPKAFSPEMPSSHSIRATLYKGTGLVRLVGLLTFPAIVAAGPTRIVRRAWASARDTTVFVGIGTVALLWYTAASGPNIGFAGNYITPSGILAQGVATGHRPDILPTGMFTLLLVVGSLAATLLVLDLVPLLHEIPARVHARDFELRDPVTTLLGLVVAGYAAAYFAAGVTNIPLYDRYALPAVPLVAILLLRPSARVATVAGDARRKQNRLAARSGIALLALTFVGAVFALDSASFDGTRWKVAVAATHQGWTRPQIRGGFEWANFYSGLRNARNIPVCVVVVVNPPKDIPKDRIVATGYYRSPLRDPVLVAAVRNRTPCTPGPRKRVVP
jgi:hypothetical protein